MGNLNCHLKLHLDKTNPSVKKQSKFMTSNGEGKGVGTEEADELPSPRRCA